MVQDVAHPVNFALEGFDADCLGLVGKRTREPAEWAHPDRTRGRHFLCHLDLSFAETCTPVQEKHHDAFRLIVLADDGGKAVFEWRDAIAEFSFASRTVQGPVVPEDLDGATSDQGRMPKHSGAPLLDEPRRRCCSKRNAPREPTPSRSPHDLEHPHLRRVFAADDILGADGCPLQRGHVRVRDILAPGVGPVSARRR